MFPAGAFCSHYFQEYSAVERSTCDAAAAQIGIAGPVFVGPGLYKLKSVVPPVVRSTILRSCPFLALTAALAAPPVPATPSQALETLRTGNYAAAEGFHTRATILNWNIDRGKRLEDIKAQIREHKPDICIFQEVDLGARRTHGEDVAKELAETFQMNYVFAPEFQELGQGTAEDPAYHGQALLTTLPVHTSRLLRFEHQSGFWKPRRLLISSLPLLQRREGGRVALVTELDNGGKPLVVYNLHLESKGTEQLRLQQLEEVLDDARRRYPPETPVIVAGDFNTFVFHSRLIPRLREAGFRSALGDRRIRTHVIAGALDWVFVRGSIQCEDGQVLHVPGSDHFPITVNVRL
jgi:endonuclease/exonuclease/phosphatase family metal-dependent hydrolase